MNLYILSLILIYVGYLLIGSIIPAEYPTGELPIFALSVNSLYLGIVIITLALTDSKKLKGILRKPNVYVNNKKLNKLIRITLILSLIGTLFIAFDRIFIQELNYTKGFAYAREQLKTLEAKSAAPSSFFSVMGYFLMGMKFWTTYYLIKYYESIPNYRNLKLIIVLFLVLIDSVIIGGRTILLYYISFSFCSFIIRKVNGRKILPQNNRLRRILRYSAVGFSVFVVFVFYQRASMNNTLPRMYAENFTYHLGGVPSEKFDTISSYNNAPQLYFLSVTGMYIYHSMWSVQSVHDSSIREGQVLFHYVNRILYKFGLKKEAPKYYEFAGRFITIPGALYHDFGLIGLINGLFIHVILLIISYLKLISNNLLSDGVFLTIASVTVLMFFHPATEFLVFPLTLSSLALIWLINKLLNQFHLWKLV
ncbi:MAG: hypothetical protein WD512_05170 [Candidatus Paceibacterota bacterium]